MSNILIIYSSVPGQARKISAYLATKLEALDHQVTTVSIDDPIDLTPFDKVVIGASIRHGKHNPAIYHFIEANQAQLASMVSSFFSINLVARKPLKTHPAPILTCRLLLKNRLGNPHYLKFLPAILIMQVMALSIEVSFVLLCG